MISDVLLEVKCAAFPELFARLEILLLLNMEEMEEHGDTFVGFGDCCRAPNPLTDPNILI